MSKEKIVHRNIYLFFGIDGAVSRANSLNVENKSLVLENEALKASVAGLTASLAGKDKELKVKEQRLANYADISHWIGSYRLDSYTVREILQDKDRLSRRVSSLEAELANLRQKKGFLRFH